MFANRSKAKLEHNTTDAKILFFILILKTSKIIFYL